jgi:hypothetical protein
MVGILLHQMQPLLNSSQVPERALLEYELRVEMVSLYKILQDEKMSVWMQTERLINPARLITLPMMMVPMLSVMA